MHSHLSILIVLTNGRIRYLESKFCQLPRLTTVISNVFNANNSITVSPPRKPLPPKTNNLLFVDSAIVDMNKITKTNQEIFYLKKIIEKIKEEFSNTAARSIHAVHFLSRSLNIKQIPHEDLSLPSGRINFVLNRKEKEASNVFCHSLSRNVFYSVIYKVKKIQEKKRRT